MLTLYVLTCDDFQRHNPKQAVKSFGDFVFESYLMTHRNLAKEMRTTQIHTEWYGYIFSDEVVDENIKNALPIYLEHKRFDCLVFMKKDGEIITQSPRIFHRSVGIKWNTFLPKDHTSLIFERALDGWILPNV